MKFTIENILGDKIRSRSSNEGPQQDAAIRQHLRDDDGAGEPSRPTSSSATQLLLARAPQPIASGARPPQACRKRKSLSDGEDDDNDMSGAGWLHGQRYL